MYISFSWTSLALVTGNKSVTRRDYGPGYVQRFKKGMIVDAYDHLPRNHGQKIAVVRLTHDGVIEKDARMPDDDYQAEGFEYFDRKMKQHPMVAAIIRNNFKLPPGMTLLDMFLSDRKHGNATSAVIRFEMVELLDAGKALAWRYGEEPWLPQAK